MKKAEKFTFNIQSKYAVLYVIVNETKNKTKQNKNKAIPS